MQSLHLYLVIAAVLAVSMINYDSFQDIDYRSKWLTFRRRRLVWIFFQESGCILINIPLKFVPDGPINSKSYLVRVTTCCHQAYPNHCWPTLMSPFDASRSQWVNNSINDLPCLNCWYLSTSKAPENRLYNEIMSCQIYIECLQSICVSNKCTQTVRDRWSE